jgi:hypothetical protein
VVVWTGGGGTYGLVVDEGITGFVVVSQGVVVVYTGGGGTYGLVVVVGITETVVVV